MMRNIGSLRKHDCKNGSLKWNCSTTPPPQIPFFNAIWVGMLHLLPGLSGFVDVNWAVALWLPVIPEFISVPRRSASSFNSNTVRSCDESPQFGWVRSNLRMQNTDAQVSELLTPSRNMSWGGMKMQVAHLGRPIRLKTWCHSSSFC